MSVAAARIIPLHSLSFSREKAALKPAVFPAHPFRLRSEYISATEPALPERTGPARPAHISRHTDGESPAHVLPYCPNPIQRHRNHSGYGSSTEVSAIRDADRIIGLLEAHGLKQIELIVNRIRMDMVKRGEMMSKEDVVDILAIDLIGAVPDDEHIVISTNQGEPLVGNDSLAGQAYMNICHRILGEEVPYLNLDNEGLFKKLANIFKR